MLFRGDDGCARVFDAHCPHLGAHLGFGGRVCGDGIACPFHGWRFDGAAGWSKSRARTATPGRCPGVGRSASATGRSSSGTMPTARRPTFEVAGYREDEEAGRRGGRNTYRVRVHVQDLTENIIDRSHFSAVHDMEPPEEESLRGALRGASMVVEQSLKVTAVSSAGFEVRRPPRPAVPGSSRSRSTRTRSRCSPTSPRRRSTRSSPRWACYFSMKRLPDAGATESISELNDQITNLQFTQDVPIWENKIYRERPMITRADGPVSQYRRWFRQFYSEASGSTRD